MRKLFFVIFLFLVVASFAQARNDILAPSSPTPGDGGESTIPVTLQWNSVDFPVSASAATRGYLLELGGGDIAAGTKVWRQATSYPLGLLRAGVTYSWKVRACVEEPSSLNGEDKCGPWSNSGHDLGFWTFKAILQQPTLIAPTLQNGINQFGDVTLQWNSVPGADSYDVAIKDLSSNGFNSTQNFRPTTANSEIKLLFLSGNFMLSHQYEWSVTPKAGLFLGTISNTAHFFFVFPSPVPEIPKNNKPASYPVSQFAWSSVPGAATYILEIFNSSDIRIAQIFSTGISVSESSCVNNFCFLINEMGGTYSWKVTACKGDKTDCGSASDFSKFTLAFAAPGGIDLQYDGTSTLSWTKPKSPLSNMNINYAWEIHKKDISNPIVRGSITTKEFSVSIKNDTVLVPGSYTLSVQSCTDSGVCSDFAKDLSPLIVESVSGSDIIAPTILTFNAEQRVGNNVTISWTASDTGGSGIGHYELWRAPDNNGSPGTWAAVSGRNNLSSAINDLTELQDIKTWWYGVHAIDIAGNCIAESGVHCPGGVRSDTLDPRQSKGPIKVEITVAEPPPASDFVIIPTSKLVDFGTVQAGQMSTRGTQPEIILINNKGFIVTGTISVSGTGYSQASPSTFSVNPGESQDVQIIFTAPSNASGTINGTAFISIGGVLGNTVNLTAVVAQTPPLGGQVVISPPGELQFNEIKVGNHSYKTLKIKNNANQQVGVEWSLFDPKPFTVLNPSSFSLSVGEEKTFAIDFSPTKETPYLVNMSFTFTKGSVTDSTSISLKGKGVATGGGGGTVTPAPCDQTTPADTTDTVYIKNPLKSCSLTDIINKVIDFLFTLSFAISPIMVIVAGFFFITGGGDPAKIKRAKEILIYTAIGFIIILMAKGLPFLLKDILGVK